MRSPRGHCANRGASEAGLALETPNDWSYFRFVELPFGVDTLTATLTHRASSLR